MLTGYQLRKNFDAFLRVFKVPDQRLMLPERVNDFEQSEVGGEQSVSFE